MLEKLKEISKAKKELRHTAGKIFKQVLGDFMNEHPNIVALGWTQYTPYFNDGETCYFNFQGLNASVDEEAKTESDLYDEPWVEVYGRANSTPPKGFEKKDWKDLLELSDLLHTLEDELRDAFGDHVKVLVRNGGIEVEEYEHE